MKQRADFAMYWQALPLYARNLGVLFPPLVAAIIAFGLDYFGSWLFAPTGGAGMPLISYIDTLLLGFALGVSVIFADDAWRHGRANLGSAWNEARRKAGNIIIAVIGFLFIIYVARMIGGFVGVPIASLVLGALALWAFLYTIPAGAIGGIPGGASLSASVQTARRNPFETALLAFVCIVVWYGLSYYALDAITPYLGIGFYAADVLLKAIAIGYIALLLARQYSGYAFRPYW